MMLRLTKLMMFPLSAAGLVILTMAFTVEEQQTNNPCTDSRAVYVNGEFVECLNDSRYRAYP